MMLEFLRKKTQLNNEAPDGTSQELRRIRKRIVMQACLAVMTVLMTVVILFGMTAAWYTNVVQSGGLIFQVETMGVNVDATVVDMTIIAQPGDEGAVNLTAANNGSGVVDITVSINKTNMDPQMQQRLYFYVESQVTANGETSQRSYVTASEGYTYQVFGGKRLTLTEQYHNAPALKWCWVYDVLGYYVLGQASNGSVQVEEYLRPIEYDYDSATFDVHGNLQTVDGTTTVGSFLSELSATDGYPGTIDTTQKVGQYYKVAVDANGYGVYAYLCTYEEVEANTDFDTALGKAASAGNPATYSALMTINAQAAIFDTITVGSSAALLNALESGEADAIVLSTDVTLDSGAALHIPADTDLLLDLNGHSLITNNSGYALNMEPNASLTITDGTISGNNAGNFASLVGAELTMNDVTVSGYKRGIAVADYSGTGEDSTVRITGCDIKVSEIAVTIYGNGAASEQTSKLLIEDSKLTGDLYAISGNGSIYGAGRWGTEIEIIRSEIMQNTGSGTVGAAIYHPQPDSTMNIYDSNIVGYTAMAIKGGSVTITDSAVIGVGERPAAPALTTSGFTDTADGIYVETGYEYDISLTIRDSSCMSYYSQGLRIFEETSKYVTYVQEGENIFQNKIKTSA